MIQNVFQQFLSNWKLDLVASNFLLVKIVF